MTWIWPRFSRREVLLWLAMFVAVGGWLGTSVWLAMAAQHTTEPWSRPYLWEMTGALSGFLASWLPITAVENAPRPAGRWARFLAIHAAGYVLFAALHTSVMLGARYVLYPVLGWGHYAYGDTAFLLPMEWHKDLMLYVVLAVGFRLITSWRDGQRRALRQAQIETELRDAQLRALVGQLNPHFLFNALNTISAVMYTDLARTDRLLADLGQMLRAGLTGDAGPTWSLAEERAHTEHFLAVMVARFGDRLRIRWEVEGAAGALQVPRFTLQLLVENAIKHNQDARGPLEIAIAAHRRGDRVEIEVADNGRGFGAPGAAGTGTGLATLRRALELCHGPTTRLELDGAAGGGARVRLWLPVAA
jgi:two-component system, LytTR family, sensor kinase